MNVGHGLYGGFGLRSLNAAIVEPDPRELHGLSGDQDGHNGNRWVEPPDQQGRGGMIDCEHESSSGAECVPDPHDMQHRSAAGKATTAHPRRAMMHAWIG